MKKAAIVGAGVSGLIVGARLAQKGFNVTVYESGKRIGGRAIGYERDGFSIDYGLHLVRNGVNGFLTQTMEALGAPIELALMSHPEFYFWQDGGLHPFPQDRQALMETELLTMEQKMTCLSMLRDGVYEQYRGTPMREWLNSVGANESLENFVRIISCAVVCPFLNRASAGEVFGSIRRRMVTGTQPAGMPVGGFYRVLDKLVEYIETHGGRVLTGAPVRGIMMKAGCAAGVETDAGPQDADIVVAAFPYKELFEVLEAGAVSPEVRDRLTSQEPTSGICIDYALDAPVTDLKSVVVTFEEPFIYGQAVSNVDTTLAPEGKQLISANMLNQIEDLQDPARADELTLKLENKMFEIWPQIPDRLMWKRVLKLKVVNSAQVNYRQYQSARPGPKEPGVPGLYLAGDGLCAPGGGGDLAVTSANLCADTILADFEVN